MTWGLPLFGVVAECGYIHTDKKKVNMDRSAQIIRTSIIGIVANVLLVAFKAVVGFVAGSVAIVMDAVNNLSDALSSVITIIGTKLSQRPADRNHPFGYGRVEYFSAMIIAVIVLSAGITSLIESVKKIITPTEPNYTTPTLIVIVVAIGVKLLLGWYVGRKGKQLKSDALLASGSDALFDALITTATLVSAGIMLVWGISLDGILGALISIVIIKAGIEMLASPVNELLGSRVSSDLVRSVKQEILGVDGVRGVYDIILHNYGPDVMIGSLHISVPDSLSAHEIHGLTRRISTLMFERHGIVLTVGIYAVATGENQRAELQARVMKALAAHKELVQVHGFYYSEKDGMLSVDVVPDLSQHDDAALCRGLTDEIRALVPDLQVAVVIDHNYSE